MIRRFYLMASCAALLASGAYFAHASLNGGDDGTDDVGSPEPSDLASQLLAAADPSALMSLANHMADGVDIDEDNIGEALSSLAGMLSSQGGLSALLEFPPGSESSVGKLLGKPETEGAVNLISQYFRTLSTVLRDNPGLKNQISAMIQQQASDLATNGSNLESVLQSIMESAAFKQLREQIEDELSEKSDGERGTAPADDMSR